MSILASNITIELVRHPVAPDQYQSLLDDDDVGSHGWFLGVTRRTTMIDGEPNLTESLYYDAKESMAVTQMNRIAAAAVTKFGISHLVMVHRLGDVAVGQASVLIGCSSPHRKQTFSALPWIMDQIKSDVPIWKRDDRRDGRSDWVHPGLGS